MANFELAQSADKVSTSAGTTSVPGANIIPLSGMIMPYAGPYVQGVASGIAGTKTITVVSSSTYSYVGQGIYSTTQLFTDGYSAEITAIAGTTITIDKTIQTTFNSVTIFYCPPGWIFCDGSTVGSMTTPAMITTSLKYTLGASSSSNIGSATPSHSHTITYPAPTGQTNNAVHNVTQDTITAPITSAAHTHDLYVGITTANYASANFVNMNNSGNSSHFLQTHSHNTNSSFLVTGSATITHPAHNLTHSNSMSEPTHSHTSTVISSPPTDATVGGALPYLNITWIRKL